MDDGLRNYREEAGEVVAERFFEMFLQVVGRALESHVSSPQLRRNYDERFSLD